MSFTLREYEDLKPGSLTVSDGTVHLLELERSSKIPMMHSASNRYSSLRWFGAMPSLEILHEQYRAIVEKLAALAPPEHAHRYVSSTSVDIVFGTGDGDGFSCQDSDMSRLCVLNSHPWAEDEVNELLSRREKDWLLATISSSPSDDLIQNSPHALLLSGRTPVRIMTFTMRLPGCSFPIEGLADCIEVSAPQACILTKANKASPGIEMRPWSISRTELISILKEIESQWLEGTVNRLIKMRRFFAISIEGQELVRNNLCAVARKFSRPWLAVLSADKTSLRCAIPDARQAVALLPTQTQ
jgi:hypothetical protein